ncbi:MAG: nucleotide exchange factor GrpE [Kordiimonadales bacterium]|nr:MAG: nucleotide exchange factor GrpE [Kordiimonadales bacterium]
MTDENQNEDADGGLTQEEIDAAEIVEETQEPSADEIISGLQSEVTVLKDRLLRAVAETQNVRRRAEKDKTDASAYAVTAFARDMLNVGDNMRRALDSQPEEVTEDMKAFTEGVAMTERELLNTMERHGIKKIEPEVGEKFDHKVHQAMFEAPSEDYAPGSVMQVVAPGFTIKSRLLRPAMVGVAKGEAKKVDTKA